MPLGGPAPLKNLLTDISGVRVGHADDAALASGVTAIIFDSPAIASIDVRGGGPGTREESVLELQSTVDAIDGIALSGGSALGLDAAGGVQAWLAEHGRGLRIRDAVIPIVPGAICFDLLNGGNKAWGRFPPYRDLGYAAAKCRGRRFRARQRRRRARCDHRQSSRAASAPLPRRPMTASRSQRLRWSMPSAA